MAFETVASPVIPVAVADDPAVLLPVTPLLTLLFAVCGLTPNLQMVSHRRLVTVLETLRG